ncbi:DUF192 domain-containing protein [Azospirillaceae bacterium]
MKNNRRRLISCAMVVIAAMVVLLKIGATSAVLASGASGLESEASAMAFRRAPLVVETSRGGKFHFNIELAETPAQQQQGMMFREKMPEDSGMLFVFGQERRATFWMMNTLISLDIIFVGRGGRIVNIHQRAEPQSLELISSNEPVVAVLEIKGGVASWLGIRPGDRVIHAAVR